MKAYIRLVGISMLLLLGACTTHYHLTGTNYYGYQIYKGLHNSESAEKLITPYRDSLTNKMNTVIGTSDTILIKEQPEGTLGNFCADAFREIAASVAAKSIDVCIMNAGGLRVPSLPKGNITVGNIYELLPFDNQLVVMEISGIDLMTICNKIAKRGGWPVSGLRMKIHNGQAIDVTINGQLLNPNSNYVIATNDYIANGGDDMDMLKNYQQQTFNILLREALVEYIRSLNSMQKSIYAKKDQRIINEP